jgi:magnesium chelatase family protein
MANGQLPADELESTVLIGELGLDGQLRKVDGALNVAIMCQALGFKKLILPKENASEASVVPGVAVYGIRSITELMLLLNQGVGEPEPAAVAPEN